MPSACWPCRPGRQYAAHDIRELHGLLDVFNTAKRTAWRTVIKIITTGFVLALIAGALLKIKLYGG
ncbi:MULTISPECIES: DUF6127 family protein [Nitrosomonas]|uniref:DUF6127 family protein n=1 Tax=Nitrosomonas TaxID=914 RepID=UPI001F30D4E5|nr:MULTISPECIES: DUF6127 family protein [Nitrosomonas]UVS62919.1 DUF6127 family protein [Nitrosomonas sp. PLL12]